MSSRHLELLPRRAVRACVAVLEFATAVADPYRAVDTRLHVILPRGRAHGARTAPIQKALSPMSSALDERALRAAGIRDFELTGRCTKRVHNARQQKEKRACIEAQGQAQPLTCCWPPHFLHHVTLLLTPPCPIRVRPNLQLMQFADHSTSTSRPLVCFYTLANGDVRAILRGETRRAPPSHSSMHACRLDSVQSMASKGTSHYLNVCASCVPSGPTAAVTGAPTVAAEPLRKTRRSSITNALIRSGCHGRQRTVFRAQECVLL